MPIEFKFPDIGEGITEGLIVKWLVDEGDEVDEYQNVVEIETDKAVVEIPSPAKGRIRSINFKEGETVKVGEVLMIIGSEVGSEEDKPSEESEADRDSGEKKEEILKRTLAAPATRKLARELGVDITKIEGSGPAGRVTREDVESASKEEPEKEKRTGKRKPSEKKVRTGIPEQTGGEERVKLSGVRKTIAERLTYSWKNIPQACGMDYADVTRLVEVREQEKETFNERGVKLTYLPFIFKACAIALRNYPQFNANFDEGTSEIVFKRRINIGMAVDTEDGLMVPVVKDIERKSIGDIARKIEELAKSAQKREITLEEMEGGTFTITNIGSLGGMYSVPIVNPPEIAILGVHRIKEMPLVIDGKIVPRKVMGFSLAFDHRVVDGASATRFMNTIIRHLSDPDLLLIDMR